MGSTQVIFSVNTSNYVGFNAADQLVIVYGGVTIYTTTTKYRDPSAWYHITFGIAGTNWFLNSYTPATALNYVATQTNTIFNTAARHQIAASSPSSFFDGVMTSVSFIDGAAVPPAYFEKSYSTNSIDVAPQPMQLSAAGLSSYGTNGFYLDFGDVTNATTLGYDTSGRGNNWGINVSTTSSDKLTYSCLYDVPYNPAISITSSNYCTLNPLQITAGSPATLPSSGNLQYTTTTATATNSKPGTLTLNAAVAAAPYSYYFEFQKSNQADWFCGYVTDDFDQYSQDPLAASLRQVYGIRFNSAGTICSSWDGSTATQLFTGCVTTDIFGIMINIDHGNIWVSRNGVWSNGSPTGNNSWALSYNMYSRKQVFIPFIRGNSVAPMGSGYVNFGQQGFSYPYVGIEYYGNYAVGINTATIPQAVVTDPRNAFYISRYTGTGAAQSVGPYNAQVYVNISYTTTAVKTLSSNVYADTNGGAFTYNSALNGYMILGANNTYTTGDGPKISVSSTSGVIGLSSTNILNNQNTVGYYNYTFRYTTVSTTNYGTFSASPIYGFYSYNMGIVTGVYTGNGTGLTLVDEPGQDIDFVMIKKLNVSAAPWVIWCNALPSYYQLYLNSSVTPQFQNDMWLYSGGFNLLTNTYVNENGSKYQYYIFNKERGVLHVAAYVGNGQTDGYFVNLGFAPVLVWIKNITNSEDWYAFDIVNLTGVTNTYNTVNLASVANQNPVTQALDLTTSSGGFLTISIDILSNGFKLRSTALNAAGNNYCYIAWAYAPVNFSLAR